MFNDKVVSVKDLTPGDRFALAWGEDEVDTDLPLDDEAQATWQGVTVERIERGLWTKVTYVQRFADSGEVAMRDWRNYFNDAEVWRLED